MDATVSLLPEYKCSITSSLMFLLPFLSIMMYSTLDLCARVNASFFNLLFFRYFFIIVRKVMIRILNWSRLSYTSPGSEEEK